MLEQNTKEQLHNYIILEISFGSFSKYEKIYLDGESTFIEMKPISEGIVSRRKECKS